MSANKYPILKSTTRLTAESHRAIIYKVDRGEYFLSVHPVQATLLACCDGESSVTDLYGIAADIMEIEEAEAKSIVKKLLTEVDEFISYQSSSVPIKDFRYKPEKFLYQPVDSPWGNKLEIPNTVVWMVTSRCPADCVYCVIPTIPANKVDSKELTTEQAFKMLAECVELGVQYVNLHGGDPFLRKDMPDIIEYLLSHGVFVDVSTKMPLRESLIERLAKAGLDTLQVSVDSHLPKLADSLVKVDNWLPKINQTIEYCLKYNLKVRANIVVTSKNVKEIPGLIEYLIKKGVKDIMMSSYLRSELKHDDSLLITQEQRRFMVSEVKEIQRKNPGIDIGTVPLKSERDISISIPGFGACSGGKTAIVIGSDGNCATCDRTMPYKEAQIGNIKESSLFEIWHGKKLGELLDPPREKYTGSSCFDCDHFNGCNLRQRCYYRAKLINGQIFTPDYLCAKLPEPPIEMF